MSGSAAPNESPGTCWEEKCGGRDGEPAATSVAAWRRRRQIGRTDGGRDARPICAALDHQTKDRGLASLSRSARLAPRAPGSPRTAFETPRLPRASGTELTMTVLERLGKSLSLRRGSRDSPRLRKQFTTADAAANLAPLRWAQAPGPRDATAPGRRRPPEQTHPVPRRRVVPADGCAKQLTRRLLFTHSHCSKHDLEDLVLPPMGAAAAAPGGGHPRGGGDAGCMVRYLSRDSIKAEHVVELTQSVR